MEKTETKDDTSYVRVEGASTLMLSIQQLAKMYTEYANLVLETKKIHDTKNARRKELFQQVNRIEADFHKFVAVLPTEPEHLHVRTPEYSKNMEEIPIPKYEAEERFENLKYEFEKIRDELKKIR